jgi:hypothetical protein
MMKSKKLLTLVLVAAIVLAGFWNANIVSSQALTPKQCDKLVTQYGQVQKKLKRSNINSSQRKYLQKLSKNLKIKLGSKCVGYDLG